MIEIDDSDDQEEQVRRKIPRTRGLKRALEQQKEASQPKTQITVDELNLVEIEKDKVGWLDRVNFHLEILIKKVNREKKPTNTHGHALLYKKSGLTIKNQTVKEEAQGNPNEEKREG